MCAVPGGMRWRRGNGRTVILNDSRALNSLCRRTDVTGTHSKCLENTHYNILQCSAMNSVRCVYTHTHISMVCSLFFQFLIIHTVLHTSVHCIPSDRRRENHIYFIRCLRPGKHTHTHRWRCVAHARINDKNKSLMPTRFQFSAHMRARAHTHIHTCVP